MSDLLDFLRAHEEAFRSRTRLASLYSDFRHQRSTNPDGYQANASAWLRALSAAAKEGLVPAQTDAQNDRLVLRTSEELERSLQTQEFGRPLALGAVVQDAVDRKELVPLREFMEAKKSMYARSWIPTPWQAVSWGLKQLGVTGGDAAEDKLIAGSFVVMANLEAAAKAVLDQASRTATSNTSRIFSSELFASSFASSVGVDAFSNNDLVVLLTHLARDRSAISFLPRTQTIKFKSPFESELSPVTPEDINIASIRTLIASIEPQIEQLTLRLSELEQTAKQAVAKKNLVAAKTALRSEKLADTKLQQRTTTLAQLEDVYAKIEQAADQVEMVRVMEASSQTLRSLNEKTGGVEKVQDVMEGLREQMMDVDEIGRAVNEVSAGEVDEGEVEDELEEMERLEREKVQEVERREREARETKEAEAQAEETRRKLSELDKLGKPQEEVSVGSGAPEPARELENERSA